MRRFAPTLSAIAGFSVRHGRNAHLLSTAGNATLMTPQLRGVLCDHAAGNYRVMTTMSAQLLSAAVQRQAAVLDEKLYFEVFTDAKSVSATKLRQRAGR